MSLTQTIQEKDELTASVSLYSGTRTREIGVDLRERASKESGPTGGWNDATDNGCPSVKVSTYMKGQEPPGSQRGCRQIEIIVKDLNGGNISITLSPQAHVSDLRKKTTQKTGVDDYRLQYGGKVMEDQRPLKYYHLENGSVVLMFKEPLRLRGG